MSVHVMHAQSRPFVLLLGLHHQRMCTIADAAEYLHSQGFSGAHGDARAVVAYLRERGLIARDHHGPLRITHDGRDALQQTLAACDPAAAPAPAPALPKDPAEIRPRIVARDDHAALLTTNSRRMCSGTVDHLPLPARAGSLDAAALPSRRGPMRVWPNGRTEKAT